MCICDRWWVHRNHQCHSKAVVYEFTLLYSKFNGFGHKVDDMDWTTTQTILTAPKNHSHLYSFLSKVAQTSAFLLRNPDILRTSKIASLLCRERGMDLQTDAIRTHSRLQHTKEFHICNYAKHSKYEAVSPKGETQIWKSHHFFDLLGTCTLLPFHAASCVAVSSKPTVCFIYDHFRSFSGNSCSAAPFSLLQLRVFCFIFYVSSLRMINHIFKRFVAPGSKSIVNYCFL